MISLFKRTIAISVLAASLATPTLAGGSLKDAPLPAAAFNWTGVYAGLQIGYIWDKSSDIPWGTLGGTTLPNNDGPLVMDGFAGGVHLGFNIRSGGAVFGIEGDLELTGAKGDDEDRGGHINGLNANWLGSIRGRAGLLLSPNTLLYATGGWAFMGADAVVRDVPSQPKISTSFNGWTLGAGLEHAFSPSMTARFEYRYTDFSREVERYAVAGYRLGFEPQVHAVRAALSFKLN